MQNVVFWIDSVAQPETEISLCAVYRQGYREKPTGKLILTANRQANPDRDKMTEKLQLSVGKSVEINFMTGIPCAATHKKI